MTENPFNVPGIASMVYTDGAVPLDAKDKQELEGMSLADRGLKEEADRLARLPVGNKIKPPPEKKKKVGRPKKDTKTVIDPTAYDPTSDIRISIDFNFVREICRSYDQAFRLLEKLSTGNWKLSSPENGGIDLEHGYDLIRRIRDAGLV